MTRMLRRAVMFVSAVTVALGGMMFTAGTANAIGVHTCGPNMQWPGNAGVVRADLLPSGFLVWDVRDYTDDHGMWVADVFVGKRRVDHKEQAYNPHGRINPVDLRKGYLVHFVIQHTDIEGRMSFSDPNASCIVP